MENNTIKIKIKSCGAIVNCKDPFPIIDSKLAFVKKKIFFTEILNPNIQETFHK